MSSFFICFVDPEMCHGMKAERLSSNDCEVKNAKLVMYGWSNTF